MVGCGEVIFGAEIAHGAELGLLRGGARGSCVCFELRLQSARRLRCRKEYL